MTRPASAGCFYEQQTNWVGRLPSYVTCDDDPTSPGTLSLLHIIWSEVTNKSRNHDTWPPGISSDLQTYSHRTNLGEEIHHIIVIEGTILRPRKEAPLTLLMKPKVCICLFLSSSPLPNDLWQQSQSACLCRRISLSAFTSTEWLHDWTEIQAVKLERKV